MLEKLASDKHIGVLGLFVCYEENVNRTDGACTIKILWSKLLLYQNKLQCLPLPLTSTLVSYLWARLGACK
jgi:hypothetical protein